MSFVGKILIVLICVMSVVFATMAIMVYATHTNWRDVVKRPQAVGGLPKGLEGQLQDVRQERDELRAKWEAAKKDLENERIVKGNDLAKLETTVAELRQQRANLEKQNQDLKTSQGEAVAAMTKTQDTLKKLREEVDTLRTNLRDAQQQRDESFEKAVALADQVHQREIDLKRLIGEKNDLSADITRQRDLLRAYDIPAEEDPGAVLPKVSGQVLAVVAGDSVELSIGSDDGLKKGHQLLVFRSAAGQNRYMGRIEVVDTAPDRAVAKILPQFRKGAIQDGDSVTSKFN